MALVIALFRIPISIWLSFLLIKVILLFHLNILNLFSVSSDKSFFPSIAYRSSPSGLFFSFVLFFHSLTLSFFFFTFLLFFWMNIIVDSTIKIVYHFSRPFITSNSMHYHTILLCVLLVQRYRARKARSRSSSCSLPFLTSIPPKNAGRQWPVFFSLSLSLLFLSSHSSD